ncbi:spidroin-2 [Halyomorpha halys]|uniref:spidroin-2 n=1 Tax=Halyomorpha halys TaxID=286706 RepID=UPI0006D4FB64|nr:putative protein TPRXL [Halyomorpha halys]
MPAAGRGGSTCSAFKNPHSRGNKMNEDNLFYIFPFPDEEDLSSSDISDLAGPAVELPGHSLSSLSTIVEEMSDIESQQREGGSGNTPPRPQSRRRDGRGSGAMRRRRRAINRATAGPQETESVLGPATLVDREQSSTGPGSGAESEPRNLDRPRDTGRPSGPSASADRDRNSAGPGPSRRARRRPRVGSQDTEGQQGTSTYGVRDRNPSGPGTTRSADMRQRERPQDTDERPGPSTSVDRDRNSSGPGPSTEKRIRSSPGTSAPTAKRPRGGGPMRRS